MLKFGTLVEDDECTKHLLCTTLETEETLSCISVLPLSCSYASPILLSAKSNQHTRQEWDCYASTGRAFLIIRNILQEAQLRSPGVTIRTVSLCYIRCTTSIATEADCFFSISSKHVSNSPVPRDISVQLTLELYLDRFWRSKSMTWICRLASPA